MSESLAESVRTPPLSSAPTAMARHDDGATRQQRLFRKGATLFREEFGPLFHRRRLADLVVRLLPGGAFPRLRALAYRLAGIRTASGVMIVDRLDLSGGDPTGITIGARTWINAHVFIDAGAPVTIGSDVAIGHHTILVTTGHEIGERDARCGPLRPRPIVIEDGVWVGARATILPGVTVGRGAVVAACAVVTRDVPSDCVVAGVPARVIRRLEDAEPSERMSEREQPHAR